MKVSDFIIGLGLIILGAIFLFENFGYIEFDFQVMWPLLLILGGLSFWIGYFRSRQDYGLLMPGTILIVYGLMFWFCAIEGWWNLEYLWPGFMLAPGLGFVFMYLFGRKEKGLLIPAGILIGMSAIFAFRYTTVLRFWPVVLIGIGIYLIYKHSDKTTQE